MTSLRKERLHFFADFTVVDVEVTWLEDLRKEWLRQAANGDCELWSVGRSVAEVRAQASAMTPDPEADESTRFYLEAARAEFERIAIDRARNAGDGHSGKDAEASVPTEPGEPTPTQLAYFEGRNGVFYDMLTGEEHTPTQLDYFEGGLGKFLEKREHDEALAKARAANAETVVAMGDALVHAGFRREDAAILWASGMGLDELKRRLATDPSVFALERGLLKRPFAVRLASSPPRAGAPRRAMSPKGDAMSLAIAAQLRDLSAASVLAMEMARDTCYLGTGSKIDETKRAKAQEALDELEALWEAAIEAYEEQVDGWRSAVLIHLETAASTAKEWGSDDYERKALDLVTGEDR